MDDTDTGNSGAAGGSGRRWLSLDPAAVDAAGRQMMTGATDLSHRFDTARAQLAQLLGADPGPAAAVAADFDTLTTAAATWCDRMHGIGAVAREMAATVLEKETATAHEFRRDQEQLQANMAAFRRRFPRHTSGEPQ